MAQPLVYTEALKVRFTLKQMKEINKLSKQSKMSKAEYIRAVIFE